MTLCLRHRLCESQYRKTHRHIAPLFRRTREIATGKGNANDVATVLPRSNFARHSSAVVDLFNVGCRAVGNIEFVKDDCFGKCEQQTSAATMTSRSPLIDRVCDLIPRARVWQSTNRRLEMLRLPPFGTPFLRNHQASERQRRHMANICAYQQISIFACFDNVWWDVGKFRDVVIMLLVIRLSRPEA